nr:C. briggsae CBR-LGC-18 protein [Haemonchus contortus]
MTKLGVALTNILSLTFILGILATVVPKTDEIPKIGVFVVVNLALMVGSLGIVVLISYIRIGESESEQKKE